jgi:hypothetical protein
MAHRDGGQSAAVSTINLSLCGKPKLDVASLGTTVFDPDFAGTLLDIVLPLHLLRSHLQLTRLFVNRVHRGRIGDQP